MNKQKKLTFFIKLTRLMLVLVCLIAVLGCEEKSTESDFDPVDNSNAPSKVNSSTINTSNSTSNSITISWTAPAFMGTVADGITKATIKSYTVYYVAGAKGIKITTSTEGVESKTVKDATTVTIDNLTENTTYVFIVVATNSAGKTSTSEQMEATTTATDINLNDFELSYDINEHAIFGEEKTYTATSTIPPVANATYAIGLTSDGLAVAGINIAQDGGAVTVDAITATGTYILTVIATATGTGYTGTKTAKLTITVDKRNISNYELGYDTNTNTIFGEEKTYTATSTIPPVANATYAIGLTSDGLAVAGINIAQDGGVVTVDAITAAGTYILTVIATATGTGYTGTKTAKLTITVDKRNISNYELGYDTNTNAIFGEEKTYTATSTIPPVANATYAIGLMSNGLAVAGINIAQDGGAITVDAITAAGTYILTVIATATGTDYTGTKTVNISISIDMLPLISTRPTIKLYDNLTIDLSTHSKSTSFKLNPDGKIGIRDKKTKYPPYCGTMDEHPSCIFSTTDSMFNQFNDTLTIYATIKPDNEDNMYGYHVWHVRGLIRQNLKSNNVYEVYSDKGLVDEQGNSFSGVIMEFVTDSLKEQDFFVQIQAQSTYSGETGKFNFKGIISSFHEIIMDNSEVIHTLHGAVDRNITGKGIKIGLIDTPIITDSDDIKSSVVYAVSLDYQLSRGRYEPLAIPSRSETLFYNHGTSMVRYMLNFAPKINIYDLSTVLPSNMYENKYFFSNLKKKHINNIDAEGDYLSYSEQIKFAKQKRINILSHSGGQAVNSKVLAAVTDYVADGGVLNISIGNDGRITNTIITAEGESADCKWMQKFLPYGIDWKDKTGAVVLLNAVFYGIGETKTSSHSRSESGDLKYFTLSIEETGNGATSQATATFSAIVALMMEANNTYNRNFTSRQLVEILFQTAKDIGEPGLDKIYGYGVVDIDKALDMVEQGTAPEFKLYENLPSIDINFDETVCIN